MERIHTCACHISPRPLHVALCIKSITTPIYHSWRERRPYHPKHREKGPRNRRVRQRCRCPATQPGPNLILLFLLRFNQPNPLLLVGYTKQLKRAYVSLPRTYTYREAMRHTQNRPSSCAFIMRLQRALSTCRMAMSQHAQAHTHIHSHKKIPSKARNGMLACSSAFLFTLSVFFFSLFLYVFLSFSFFLFFLIIL